MLKDLTLASESVSALMVTGAIDLASRVNSNVQRSRDGALKSLTGVARGKSLVQIANAARVEPQTFVDADCTKLDCIDDVMQSCLTLFACYYIQAIEAMNSVGSIRVAERLAPFNPAHSMGMEGFSAWANNRFRLMKKAETRQLAQEADQKGLDKLGESSNLSVGKIFNVALKEETGCVNIPIAIRLLVSVLPSTQLTQLFTYRDAFDMSLKERWYATRDGRLGFWKDFVLCKDLIRKQRNMAITDKSGVGKVILDREAGAIKKAMSGIDSYSGSCNIAVIGTSTLHKIEEALGGKMAFDKVKRTFFANTNLMILVVVRSEYDQVQFFVEGTDAPTTLDIRQLKTANKSSGTDVVEIMKAFMHGSSASF